MRVTILDYGLCNLLNVARAFDAIGAGVDFASSPAEAAAADRLVVPGVGAFRDSIAEVRNLGLDDAIRAYVSTGRPFLGICVGMQMLFDASEEFGEHAGLGILSGRVKAVPAATLDGAAQRVPHIGWNALHEPEGRSWGGTVLERFREKEPAVYFVHSFAADPEHHEDRLADCYYGGHALCAAVQRENLVATQFHPERSGECGLDILRCFLAL